MPMKRMLMELGMGTDIRGGDYTKAAVRAVENALRQNSITIADAFGQSRDAMHVKILIGAQKPEEVDKEKIASILPYGERQVEVFKGGMDTPKDDGSLGTTMVNAALLVYLDLPESQA